MQIDIDYKDNLHLKDYNLLLNKLPLIKNIAYCGQSVSGLGYWGLVPITQPDKLHLHFYKFNELIKEHFNINLDTSKGKNITDLRIYSYDVNAYFNVNAEPFSLLAETKKEAQPLINDKTPTQFYSDKFEYIVYKLNGKSTYTEGNRNNYLVCLAGYCNVTGIAINDVIQGCMRFVNDEYTPNKITSIIQSVYLKHSSKFNSKPIKNQ